MDRIKRLRWQQRSLPDSIKLNLSPQEIQVHHLHGHKADTCVRGGMHLFSNPWATGTCTVVEVQGSVQLNGCRHALPGDAC